MALLASLSYPVGWIYVRRTLAGTGHSHLSMTGGQLLLATVQLAVVTPLFTTLPTRLPGRAAAGGAALGALGTGLAMLLQYGLVAEVGPTTAQMVTYFIPVIATAAGVAVLGEALTWSTPVGAVIVLAGAALTQARPKPKAPSSCGRGGPVAATRRSARPWHPPPRPRTGLARPLSVPAPGRPDRGGDGVGQRLDVVRRRAGRR